MAFVAAPRTPCVPAVGMANLGMECHLGQEQQAKPAKQHKVRVGKLYSCDRRRLMNRFRAQAGASARAETESASAASESPAASASSPSSQAGAAMSPTIAALMAQQRPPSALSQYGARDGASVRHSSPHSSSSDACSSAVEAWDQEPVKLVRRASGWSSEGSLEIVSVSLAQHATIL